MNMHPIKHAAFEPAREAVERNAAGRASLARIEEKLAAGFDEVIVGRLATSGMIDHYRQRSEDAEEAAAIAQRDLERCRSLNASLREEVSELTAENEALARALANKRVLA